MKNNGGEMNTDAEDGDDRDGDEHAWIAFPMTKKITGTTINTNKFDERATETTFADGGPMGG
jgi:hypothetical protein